MTARHARDPAGRLPRLVTAHPSNPGERRERQAVVLLGATAMLMLANRGHRAGRSRGCRRRDPARRHIHRRGPSSRARKFAHILGGHARCVWNAGASQVPQRTTACRPKRASAPSRWDDCIQAKARVRRAACPSSWCRSGAWKPSVGSRARPGSDSLRPRVRLRPYSMSQRPSLLSRDLARSPGQLGFASVGRDYGAVGAAIRDPREQLMAQLRQVANHRRELRLAALGERQRVTPRWTARPGQRSDATQGMRGRHLTRP